MDNIFKKYEYTHMPYIFYEDGQMRALFTVLEGYFWKLYYTDFKKIYKVKTNLDTILGSKKYHMCQPTCFKQGNKYKISFCIQFQGKIRLYYCQTTNIKNIKNLQLIKNECFGGCVSPNYIMINQTNNCIYIIQKSNELHQITDVITQNCKYQFLCKQNYLARTSYVFGNDKQLIISYADPIIFERYGSIYLNLDDIQSQKIIYDYNDQPLYKATIDPYTEAVYYGKKIGHSFEERQITKTNLNEVKSKSSDLLELLIFNK